MKIPASNSIGIAARCSKNSIWVKCFRSRKKTEAVMRMEQNPKFFGIFIGKGDNFSMKYMRADTKFALGLYVRVSNFG